MPGLPGVERSLVVAPHLTSQNAPLVFSLFDNRGMDGSVGTVPADGDVGINTEEQDVRSNAIRHTVDALASRGDEGRDKLR